MWKRNGFVLMEAASDGTAGGAASGAGETSQGGGEPSLLSQAAAGAQGDAQNGAAAGAEGNADPLAFIPEKYRVAGADGKVDLTASAQKVAAAHAELEKHLGARGPAPANADEYKADAVLAKLKEATGAEVKLDDAQAKGFRETAHKLGLSQAQYEGIVGAYFENVQGMVDGAFDNLMERGRQALSKVWGDPTSDAFKTNLASSLKAFNAYAPADMRTQQVMDQIGNNPVVLQILANVGKELKEDKLPNSGGIGADDMAALQKSEAYWNAKHPDHERVVAKVNAYYQAGGRNPLRAA